MNCDDFPETIIPVENADANFLFVVGLGDRNWKSEEFADKAIKRLQQAGRNNYEVRFYSIASRLLTDQQPSFMSSFALLVSSS